MRDALRMAGSCLSVALVLGTAACFAPEDPLTQPAPLLDPNPFRYPVELWDQGVGGETMLLMLVNEHGGVDSVAVYNPSGHDQFDSSAVQGARTMRFVPGRRGMRPVRMWTKLPVRFQVDSTRIGRS